MGIMAAIVGAVGGLCAAMGIVTAVGVIEPMGAQFTWMFWFALSAVLLLGSIALALGRGQGYE